MRSTSCTSGIRRSIAMVRASPVTSPASDAARACLGLVLGLARVRSRPATTHSRSRPRAAFAQALHHLATHGLCLGLASPCMPPPIARTSRPSPRSPATAADGGGGAVAAGVPPVSASTAAATLPRGVAKVVQRGQRRCRGGSGGAEGAAEVQRRRRGGAELGDAVQVRCGCGAGAERLWSGCGGTCRARPAVRAPPPPRQSPWP